MDKPALILLRRFAFLPFLLLGMTALAEPKVPPLPSPIDPPIPPPSGPSIRLSNAHISPKTPRTFDFTGENIQAALRTLGRAGMMNLVVADDVEGTVNMRIEDKTPKEALDIIVESKDLVCHQGSAGIYFIRTKNPPIRISAADKAEAGIAPTPPQLTEDLLPALTGFSDAMLDYQGRPETARKIARAKRAYYEALIAQGFTKEQALRIIRTNQELSGFDSKK